MPRVRKHMPALVGSIAALAVLLVALIVRDGDNVAAPGATTTVHTESDTRAATAGSTKGAELAALGQRLVTPSGARPPAPSFDIETASFADGSTFRREGGEPGPITVVFFMAAWCFSCQPEAVALGRLHKEYSDHDVTVLIVDVDQREDEDDLARFRTRTGDGGHLWAFDREFRMARALDVHTLDATVVIDRRGLIAYRDGSPTGYQYLAAVVETLLAEGA